MARIHARPTLHPAPGLARSGTARGAQAPRVQLTRTVGNTPIATVDSPIVRRAATSVVLRPTRSPK